MDIPSVSVIITSYNQADLLAQTIQSVVDQTYQDFELIVVDDGSRDHSLKVIEAYRSQRPDQIFLYTHDGHCNKGIVSSYQLGFSKVRGRYVAFLEHDDRWSRYYLASKMDIFRTYPQVGVIFSPYKIVGKGWFGLDMILRQWLLQLTILRKRPFDNFANLIKSNNVATFSCFVTRKVLLEKMPSPPLSILAYDWWILVYLSTFSLFFYDEKSFTLWRWSRSSAIGRQTFQKHRDCGTDFMKTMYTSLEENIDDFNGNKKEVFLKHKALFSHFLVFYRAPNLTNFLKFLKRAPMWALASAASLIINYLKFEMGKKNSLDTNV